MAPLIFLHLGCEQTQSALIRLCSDIRLLLIHFNGVDDGQSCNIVCKGNSPNFTVISEYSRNGMVSIVRCALNLKKSVIDEEQWRFEILWIIGRGFMLMPEAI